MSDMTGFSWNILELELNLEQAFISSQETKLSQGNKSNKLAVCDSGLE